MPSVQQPEFTLWLSHEHIESVDPDCDFTTMLIKFTTGEVYALDVYTFGYVEYLRHHIPDTGECLGGRYDFGPELLVQRLDRTELEEIVRDMIENYGLKDEWRV